MGRLQVGVEEGCDVLPEVDVVFLVTPAVALVIVDDPPDMGILYRLT